MLLGGWALALALAWPVLVLREAAFDPARLGDTVNAGQALASIEGVIGVLYVAVLIWRVVGIYARRAPEE